MGKVGVICSLNNPAVPLEADFISFSEKGALKTKIGTEQYSIADKLVSRVSKKLLFLWRRSNVFLLRAGYKIQFLFEVTWKPIYDKANDKKSIQLTES